MEYQSLSAINQLNHELGNLILSSEKRLSSKDTSSYYYKNKISFEELEPYFKSIERKSLSYADGDMAKNREKWLNSVLEIYPKIDSLVFLKANKKSLFNAGYINIIKRELAVLNDFKSKNNNSNFKSQIRTVYNRTEIIRNAYYQILHAHLLIRSIDYVNYKPNISSIKDLGNGEKEILIAPILTQSDLFDTRIIVDGDTLAMREGKGIYNYNRNDIKEVPIEIIVRNSFTGEIYRTRLEYSHELSEQNKYQFFE